MLISLVLIACALSESLRISRIVKPREEGLKSNTISSQMKPEHLSTTHQIIALLNTSVLSLIYVPKWLEKIKLYLFDFIYMLCAVLQPFKRGFMLQLWSFELVF
jgi:hypothetical protein